MQLDKQLRKFLKVEDPVFIGSYISKEDILCKEHYQSTYQCVADGRYIVALPFQNSLDWLDPS